MTKRGKRKIGRNEPCPCGSGEKYKRCHGRPTAPPLGPSTEEVKAMLNVHEAQELLRQHQQGLGRPIVSAEIAGHRVTAVGNKIHWSPNHKTFFDFLGDYIRKILDPAWGNAEIKKPLKNRHQIMQWYDAFCAFQRKHRTKPKGEIEGAPINGLVSAYFGLAYNLYLLQHNVEIQSYLIRRLKHKDQFYGAYYETFVATWFILAGFELSLENEEDPSCTHVEFVATRDGRSYSVEVKARQPEKDTLDIGNQLWKALSKDASHPRIVFIDINVGPDVDLERFPIEVMESIRGREENSNFQVKGQPAPPAYVIVTNQPYHLGLDDVRLPRAWLGAGFKIPDFGHEVAFPTLVDAHKAREKHADIRAVQDAFENYRIPITFDGEVPEIAFGDAERRFIIGHRHQLDDGVVGTLASGLVMESEKQAYLVYNSDDGRSLIYTAELSDAELAAYQAHPETFFGRVVKQGGNIDQPIDMFEFMLDSYKESSRDTLLDFFKDSSDLEELKNLSDDELHLVHAERSTLGAMRQVRKSQDKTRE